MEISLIALALPDYFYFVFGVCAFISACIVLFYAKRHPNPHFRPKKSDIGVVSFILLFVSGGVAFFTSGAMDLDISKEKLERKMEDAKREALRKGTSVEEELGLGDGGSARKGGTDGADGDIPSEVPEELRDVLKGRKE